MGTISVFDARAAIHKAMLQLVNNAVDGKPAIGAAVLSLQDNFFVPELENDLSASWPALRLVKAEIPYLILIDKNPHRRVLGTLFKALHGKEISRGSSSKVVVRDLLLSFSRLGYVFLIDFAERIDSQSIDFLVNPEVKTPCILLGRSDRLWPKLASLNGSVNRFSY